MFYLLILTVLIIFGATNYYLGIRTWHYFAKHIPFLNIKIYWLIFILFSSTIFLSRVNLFQNFYLNKILSLSGYYWFVIMLYSYIILLIVDLILFIFKKINNNTNLILHSHFNLIIGTFFITILSALLIYGSLHSKTLYQKQYEIEINKSSKIKNLNIALISDLHLGNIIDKVQLEKIVSKVNSLNPDIVFITGDIVDDSVESYNKQQMYTTFQKLNSKHGTYAILGNHDKMEKNQPLLKSSLEKGNITLLVDEIVNIENSFYIVGRDDTGHSNTSKRSSLSKLITNTDKNLPIILLDHKPSNLDEAVKNNIDLQLSGHTHAGQFFPVTPITYKMYEQSWGYLKKDNLNLIVTSGTGTWGPPIRIGTNSEIVNILVNFKSS